MDEDDSELIRDLCEALEKHGVTEGLRETIVDMVQRWEMEEGDDV